MPAFVDGSIPTGFGTLIIVSFGLLLAASGYAPLDRRAMRPFAAAPMFLLVGVVGLALNSRRSES